MQLQSLCILQFQYIYYVYVLKKVIHRACRVTFLLYNLILTNFTADRLVDHQQGNVISCWLHLNVQTCVSVFHCNPFHVFWINYFIVLKTSTLLIDNLEFLINMTWLGDAYTLSCVPSLETSTVFFRFFAWMNLHGFLHTF